MPSARYKLHLRTFKRAVKVVLRATSKRPHSADTLLCDLRALGVRRGALLMVHSSLSSLGYVRGGAKSVIKALSESIGPDGTLVMPTHTWDRPARGDFQFDVRNTPSCVGAITEAFRCMPGALRSLHPTHSVAAMGPQAAYLTELHEMALTPCGPGTPYMKLIDDRCQILFLGTTLEENTVFHALEAIADLPYLMREADEEFMITDSSGMAVAMRFRRHNRGPERRFAEPMRVLREKGVVRSGKVGESCSLLVECAPMADVVLAEIRRDSNYLLRQGD